jgi:hypothetical protein
MSDTVLAALISAGASILVAILSKSAESRKHSLDQSARSDAVRMASKDNSRRWYIASAILLFWFAFSPAFVHHDLAGTNFLLIPVVAVVLALATPISPLRGAWIVLALFAANFMLGPLSNQLHGSSFDTAFIYPQRERGKQVSILLIGFGTAVITSGICYLRLRARDAITSQTYSVTDRDSAFPDAAHLGLAAELERLARLHSDGTLSVDEFRRAKQKLLKSR